MPIKKNKIGAKKPAAKPTNPVLSLFSGVAKAEVTQGVPKLEKPGIYLLALESCNVEYTRADTKPYVKIYATVAHAYEDENRIAYGAEGYNGHEPGDSVTIAIFKSDYFDKEMKKFIMTAFNLEDHQVQESFILGVAGFDEKGEDTGAQVVTGVALKVKVVLRPGKKVEGQPNKFFANTYFEEALSEEEVRELIEDDEDFVALFPDGVTFFEPSEDEEETED